MSRKIKASYLIEPDQREKYSCPECEYILADAVQISCGHLLCYDCAEDLKSRCSPCCPRHDCREELRTEEFFSDKCVHREIRALPLACQCLAWKGSVGEFCDDHREKCPVAECSAIIEAESPLLKSQVGACQETSQASTAQCTGLGIMRAPSPAENVQCPSTGIPTTAPPRKFYLIYGEKEGFSDHKVCGMIGMGETGGEGEADSEVKAGAGAQARRSESSLVKEMQAKMIRKDEAIQILENKVEQLENNQSMLFNKIYDTEFRITIVERTFNGSFLWKIPEVSKRREDARTGKYASIFSLPFYSSRYGYKMCLRLYILGDGIGKGTHMSLFFVIMKGEFDNILHWPFTHKVTFKLINKHGGRDVVESIRPDLFSSSFHQPKSDMNVASGCPRFVSIKELLQEGFIVDDTIFIEVEVDTSDGVNQAP